MIPLVIEQFLLMTVGMADTMMVTSFDAGVDLLVQGSAVAANAIGGSIAGVTNVPGQGAGLSMVTVVGQAMGAGDHAQAVGYTKKLMKVSYASMCVMSLALYFGSPYLVPLFNLTPATAAMAVGILRWHAVFGALFWPMAFTMPNALRAAGDAKFTMTVSMLSMWICRIGFSYLLGTPWGLNMGLLGAWLGMFFDWVVRAVVFLIHFLRGK